ncbi:MAG: hypothetical protein JHC26_01900 [Thermofilum sp.]|jgi:hypothetical protein|uniref:hypothetical protein n=1 Tax=Thermofilum sp. TaxID=1961369 RepID=UPI00258C2A64|nr:hypothetical protein [Thermofilum sp.]MCI4407816.1 hypothetical protein [Thermofilum sp.]
MNVVTSSKVINTLTKILEKKLRRELTNYAEVEVETSDERIFIYLGTRLERDIIEKIASFTDDYCAKHCIAEEECMRHYINKLDSYFDSFNEENSIDINGKISLPWITITLKQKEALLDDDLAGMYVEIHIKSEKLCDNIEEVAEQIAKLIASVYRLA